MHGSKLRIIWKQVVQNQHSRPHSDPKQDGGNGEGPGQVVVFSRDAATGGLTPTGTTVRAAIALPVTTGARLLLTYV